MRSVVPANVWTHTRPVTRRPPSLPRLLAAPASTKVDECDIAKDLGITKNTSIEKAFIDGIEVANTSDKVTKQPLCLHQPACHYLRCRGAQGRLTEGL